MNVLIRCDSSNIIGTGHVMRCLNLASYYHEYKFTFICRNFKMNISEKIKNEHHNLILLDYNIEPNLNNYKTWIGKNYDIEITEFINIVRNKNYDIVLIDHYGIDYLLEIELIQYCKHIIVISDIFDFKHYCQVFINYNCDDIELVKNININNNTIYKITSKNIIINKEFIKSEKKYIFNEIIQILTINMGGADPQNYTLKVLENIHEYIIKNNITVNIIIGKSNSNTESIKHYSNNFINYNIYYDLSYINLIKLYINSDLVIGSLSITAYERLFINIPQICLEIIDNQKIQQLDIFNIVDINEIVGKILTYKKIIKDYINKSNVIGVPNVTSILTCFPNKSQ